MKLPPRRLQRIPLEWPIVHLEAECLSFDSLRVGGMVKFPLTLRLSELLSLQWTTRTIPIHCVWGWSKPEAKWTGVPMSEVLALAEPEGGFVTVRSAAGCYSSCLPLRDAAEGFLAWMRDGVNLDPISGGPLRFIAPSRYWAYKGAKWASHIIVHDRFVPGFWESRVEDPPWTHSRGGRSPVSAAGPTARHATSRCLEKIAEARGVSKRDCRRCPKYESQGDGLSYGWCRAHRQFVKLYHPAGQFWSQCQFKSLSRERHWAEISPG